MNFLSDWHFWFALINLIGLGIIGGFNWFSHNKLVGNDLTHLSADVKKIGTTVERIDGKIDKHDTRIAVLEEKTKKL